jgi:erythromycin esterase
MTRAAIVTLGVGCLLGAAAAARQDDPLRRDALATDAELAPPAGVAGAPLPHAKIRSLTSPAFDDLAFLEPLLKDVEVVQLGENGHGMAEALLLRARLVRFLHQRLGFTVLALESSMYLGAQGDARAANASARAVLTSSTIGVWHTEEMLPLFEYLRATRTGSRPLRLAGFDVQPIGSGKKTRPAFFRSMVGPVDEAYGRAVEAFDAEFIAEYDQGRTSRVAYFRANRDRLISDYERLAEFVDRHRAAIEGAHGRERTTMAVREAASMAAYVRYQAATAMLEYAEGRDRAMADNVLAIARRMFPGQKVIVWTHNYHASHANERIPPRDEIFPGVRARAMGGYLKAALGPRLFTIGVSHFAGEAADNSRAPYTIAPAPKESIDYRLTAAGGRLAFFDLRSAAWAREPGVWRYNGQHAQTIVPAEQYDAILSIAMVSPPRFLK